MDLRRLSDSPSTVRWLSDLLDRLRLPRMLLDCQLDEVSGGEALRLLRNCANEQGLAVLLITHSIVAAHAISDGMVYLQPTAPDRPNLSNVRVGSHGG